MTSPTVMTSIADSVLLAALLAAAIGMSATGCKSGVLSTAPRDAAVSSDAISMGGVVGTGGIGTTGGASGSGGVTGKGGTAGTGSGGVVMTGGTTGGGVTGKGGTAGTGTGGVTSTYTKTEIGHGGYTGTGGLTFGTGGIGGMGGGTAVAMLQPLGDAACAATRSCCGRASYPTANLANCESVFPSAYGDVLSEVDRGAVVVDATALATCVAAFKTAATTCDAAPLRAACAGVLNGTRTANQSCGMGSQPGQRECKRVNGLAICYWDKSPTDAASTGVCINPPRSKEGDACSVTLAKGQTLSDWRMGSNISGVCLEEDGLYCAWSKKPNVCRPIRAIDQACTMDENACGSGNFCDGTTNTCQVVRKLGEDCEDAACGEGLECTGELLKCTQYTHSIAEEIPCVGTSATLHLP
jgi:hypothetical protein